MSWVLSSLWFGAIVVAPLIGALRVRDRAVDEAVVAMSRATGLEATPGMRPAVALRMRVQRRWGSMSGAAVLVPASLLIGTAFGWSWSLPMVWTLVAATVAAVSVGAAVASLRAQRPTSGEVRVARGSVVRAADYVPPLERAAARVVPAVALAVVLAAAVTGGALAPTIVNTTLVVGSVLAWELGSRRIVAAPQPARSPEELAWQDAFRSQDLLTLAQTSMGVSAYAGFLSAWTGGAAAVTLTAVAVGVVAIGMAWLAQLRSERAPAARHFLRRLWPEVARDLETVAP